MTKKELFRDILDVLNDRFPQYVDDGVLEETAEEIVACLAESFNVVDDFDDEDEVVYEDN